MIDHPWQENFCIDVSVDLWSLLQCKAMELVSLLVYSKLVCEVN
jgi:hypothetical protein